MLPLHRPMGDRREKLTGPSARGRGARARRAGSPRRVHFSSQDAQGQGRWEAAGLRPFPELVKKQFLSLDPDPGHENTRGGKTGARLYASHFLRKIGAFSSGRSEDHVLRNSVSFGDGSTHFGHTLAAWTESRRASVFHPRKLNVDPSREPVGESLKRRGPRAVWRGVSFEIFTVLTS